MTTFDARLDRAEAALKAWRQSHYGFAPSLLCSRELWTLIALEFRHTAPFGADHGSRVSHNRNEPFSPIVFCGATCTLDTREWTGDISDQFEITFTQSEIRA